MPGLIEGSTPSYISSQSADVILSDVRPFKLKIEALHAINVLLDEFLYNILNAAASLSTDRLRASLLGLLPTSLGKEALLEAEVELRAYWDRTNAEGGPAPPPEDDSRVFHLQWSFELLRMKCEAYSTLNESDEDPSAEDRIQARFAQSLVTPPDGALLAPAALYLTAILEAMCEHILTNVGRVAARDSSRVSATVNDLFTALCEDDSIYGLFRSMRVYERIELLSKGPMKSRRSKSFSRSELSTTLSSRTGSPHQDLLSGKDSISVQRSRPSSEAPPSTFASMPGLTTTTSRSSAEKTRSLKMYKSSTEADSINGHRVTESFISEKLDDGQQSGTEESALLEFDDLMRSSSTMKVSLTPDRLKTMEVYKQEKDIRRRPAPLSFKSDNDTTISTKLPSLRHVDSIVEDEEELAFPQNHASNFSRTRSVAMIPTSPSTSASNTRTRSISTSSLTARGNLLKNKQVPPLPSTFSQTPRTMTRPNKPEDLSGFPPRTRQRQTNRESLDLDDVMGDSDDEYTQPPTPSTHSAKPKDGKVSAATKELMDFLAQGPPGEPPRPAQHLGSFVNNGYSNQHHPSSASFDTKSASLDAKPKGAQLRKMISKLSIGKGEKNKNGTSTPVLKQPPVPVLPTPPRPPKIVSQHSLTGLASLANRPIPPRPPRPPSPPPSDQEISPPPSPVKKVAPLIPYSPSPSSTRSSNRPPSPALIPPRKESRERTPSRHTTTTGSAHNSLNGSVQSKTNGHIDNQTKRVTDVIAPNTLPLTQATDRHNNISSRPSPQIPEPQTSHTTTPAPAPSGPDVGLSPAEVGHLHRLMSRATSADECRLVLDMLIMKHKISLEFPDDGEHSLPPTPGIDQEQVTSSKDTALEESLVGFFLGEEDWLEGVPRVTSNGAFTPSPINTNAADIKSPTPIKVTPPSSSGFNSSTLVGEMKA